MSKPVYYPLYVISKEGLYHPLLPRRRLKLTITLDKTNDRQALVIMMNPAKADNDVSDSTVNRVIGYIHENNEYLKIGKIIIFNLYAIYEQDSSKLGDLVETFGFEICTANEHGSDLSSNIHLQKEAAKSVKIIAAWGRPKGRVINLEKSDYKRRIFETIQILRQHEVFYFKDKLVDGKYPRHASRIGFKWTLSRLDMKNQLILFKQ